MFRLLGAVHEPRELQYSLRDGLLVGLSIALGAALIWYPSAPTIALALWWNANTIAHNFIHRPFFHAAHWNRAYSLYLSALLGFPQTWWRDRHLAHHAGAPFRIRLSGQFIADTLVVAMLWATLLARSDNFFLTVYLPGIVTGLGVCWLHGYFEHADGTVSHYGSLYNRLFLNDGYHAEHHRSPGAHWTELTNRREPGARGSEWPAVLRWLGQLKMLDRQILDQLERLALRSGIVQRYLLRSHEGAMRRLTPRLDGVRSVKIIGGGMYPRTAILLQRLLPEAALTIVDASAANIAAAERFLDGAVAVEHRTFDGSPEAGVDLLVIPLSFRGNRSAIYDRPPAPNVFVHDWIWAPQGESAVVSWFLLKRLNLIQRVKP